MTQEEIHDALYDLWKVFLHMRAWGLPEYSELDVESREGFAKLVLTKTLFAYVEDRKRDVLRAGIQVPDEWLSVLCASSITPSAGLKSADRDKLEAILQSMYPLLVRLDPDAVRVHGEAGWWTLSQAAEVYAKDAELKKPTATTRLRRALNNIEHKGEGRSLRLNPESVAMWMLQEKDPDVADNDG